MQFGGVCSILRPYTGTKKTIPAEGAQPLFTPKSLNDTQKVVVRFPSLVRLPTTQAVIKTPLLSVSGHYSGHDNLLGRHSISASHIARTRENILQSKIEQRCTILVEPLLQKCRYSVLIFCFFLIRGARIVNISLQGKGLTGGQVSSSGLMARLDHVDAGFPEVTARWPEPLNDRK